MIDSMRLGYNISRTAQIIKFIVQGNSLLDTTKVHHFMQKESHIQVLIDKIRAERTPHKDKAAVVDLLTIYA